MTTYSSRPVITEEQKVQAMREELLGLGEFCVALLPVNGGNYAEVELSLPHWGLLCFEFTDDKLVIGGYFHEDAPPMLAGLQITWFNQDGPQTKAFEMDEVAFQPVKPGQHRFRIEQIPQEEPR